jgi:hypothetical protein
VPLADRVTTFGFSRTAVPPPLTWIFGASAAVFRSGAVSAAAVRATLLRLPSVHSAMCAKKASV